MEALRAAGSPQAKMIAFERQYEAAGVKAYGRREAYMR